MSFKIREIRFFNQTVYSEIAYSLKYLKIDKEEIDRRVNAAAKMCYLSDELQTNPYDLPFSIRKFVTIASVVAMDADVVVLDEPTAGQDLLGLTYQKEIIEQLHQMGKTVITISHDMEFVIENFDRILVMADKKIIGDADKREIFWNFELLDKAALKQPVVAQLANRLTMKRNIINIDDFVSEYEK
jgi:energy-coupling factor transport system ATP-binding protein